MRAFLIRLLLPKESRVVTDDQMREAFDHAHSFGKFEGFQEILGFEVSKP